MVRPTVGPGGRTVEVTVRWKGDQHGLSLLSALQPAAGDGALGIRLHRETGRTSYPPIGRNGREVVTMVNSQIYP
jgi:hypothetical protein